MPKGKTTKSPTKTLVRGANGSSFVDCPYCKKSVPAVLGSSHQAECSMKLTANNKEPLKVEEKVPEKRKVEHEIENAVENELERDQKKSKTGVSQQLEEVEEFAPPEGTNSKKKAPSPTKEEINSWINGKSEETTVQSPTKPAQPWWPQKNEKPPPVNTKEGILQYLTEPTWLDALQAEFGKEYFRKILTFLESEKKKGKKIFPPENEIFSAFNLTPLNKVSVVIIGQDPYHGVGQAHGLCFSVKPGVTAPPSLKNIYKELQSDLGEGFTMPANNNGFLESWAKQGVLMMNATMTVEAGSPNSHQNIGWQTFTDAVIKIVNEKCDKVAYILMGSFAQKKAKGVNTRKNLILNAAHPSPYSADKFFGCKVFSKTNEYLKSNGKKEIDWNVQPITQ